MNARTKIFIAEYDCAKLISLMLWLEQFPEFEISGSARLGAGLMQKIQSNQPDVVLIDVHPGSVDSLPLVRAIKSFEFCPAVMATSSEESSMSDGSLSAEADEVINPASSIKDLCESIRRLANKRKTALAAANRPLTMAG